MTAQITLLPGSDNCNPALEKGSSNHGAGRAGEYIVAADLELAGCACSFAREGLPYGLIVQAEDGRLLRLQVKSTGRVSQQRMPRGRTSRYYKFKTKMKSNHYCDIDVFAFVALDIRRVIYMAASSVPSWTTLIPEERFAAAQSYSLSESIAAAGSG